MISKDTINAALTAHSQWKKRLLDAVNSGHSEFKIEDVKKDNACQFGKWLYSLTDQEKSFLDFEKIRNLHAEFHHAASEILELATTGNKPEAHKRLEPGGGYGRISGKLVLALSELKDKI